MERRSVSEGTKRWTTLKTEVVGGPSNIRELNKQIQWRQKRP